MSARVNQFCDTVLDRLNVIEERLQSVKANLQRLPELEAEAARSEFEASRAKLRSQRQGTKLKMNEESKGTQTADDLYTNADRAEANATEIMEHAAASIDEAEDAILYAAVARLNADAAN